MEDDKFIEDKDKEEDVDQSEEKDKGKSKGKGKKKKKDKEDKEAQLSPEDREKKEALELMVTRVEDQEAGIAKMAIEELRVEIKSSTSSMTSVPKPLKFLRPHYGKLKEAWEAMSVEENKKLLADVLSILAMTMGGDGSRESLKFKLLGDVDDIGSWGHEYVRQLSKEVAAEHEKRLDEGAEDAAAELLVLVDQIVPYNMTHNAEHEACDLLMELEQLPKVLQHVDGQNFERVCLYLLNCADYVAEPEDTAIYKVVLSIYQKMGRKPETVRVAGKLGDTDLMKQVFMDSSDDPAMQKQLAFLLARARCFDLADEVYEFDDAEELSAILLHSNLYKHYQHLGRDLGVLEPKTPEDIYKQHLVDTRGSSSSSANNGVDSARVNLAATYVNAFVNAGFGSDKVLADDPQKWIYRNKDHGMLAAAGSLGLIHMWDVEPLLTAIDKFTHSTNQYIQAGSHLAVGLVLNWMKSEIEPALAFFDEAVNGERGEDGSPPKHLLISSCMALAIAYAGTNRSDLLEELKELFDNESLAVEILSCAALAIGMIGVSSADGEATDAIVQMLDAATEEDLANTHIRFACVGLGLLYLGTQETCDVAELAVQTLDPSIAGYAQVLLQTCAYAGTGNVLQIQRLLHICGEHRDAAEEEARKRREAAKDDMSDDADDDDDNDDDDEKKKDNDDDKNNDTNAGSSSTEKKEKSTETIRSDNADQAAAVLGIALIAMGEELGNEMSLRAFDHLLQYGDPVIRCAVPLGLALTSVSNPRIAVSDTLSKLSHDNDSHTAQNAIFALGLIGAGTNNSRIAGMLRSLSAYYTKDPNTLFVVRIAQGLLHMGKGTLTIAPFHSAGPQLLSGASIGGILTVLHCFLDVKQTLFDEYHYFLYYLAAAMWPRMLMTFDEDLKPLPVDVRVGTAVDVVGQAGKPKTITAFQTHTTPVLLGHGERAELATDEYLPLNNNLDGFVILRKKPSFTPSASSSSSS